MIRTCASLSCESSDSISIVAGKERHSPWPSFLRRIRLDAREVLNPERNSIVTSVQTYAQESKIPFANSFCVLISFGADAYPRISTLLVDNRQLEWDFEATDVFSQIIYRVDAGRPSERQPRGRPALRIWVYSRRSTGNIVSHFRCVCLCARCRHA